MKAGRKPLTRSEVMSRIHGKDTGPELLLRRAVWAAGGRYRSQWRHPSGGSIDIAFPGLRVAVQVDGCFWHGCPRHATQPRARAAFWAAKFSRNQARDREVTRTLRKGGWTVVRVWECDLAKVETWPRVARRISRLIALR